MQFVAGIAGSANTRKDKIPFVQFGAEIVVLLDSLTFRYNFSYGQRFGGVSTAATRSAVELETAQIKSTNDLGKCDSFRFSTAATMRLTLSSAMAASETKRGETVEFWSF